MDSLLAADPVARIVAHLQAALTPAPGDTENALAGCRTVSAHNEPPYPCIVVSDPPGGDVGRGQWIVRTAVQIEVMGAPDGSVARSTLKAVAYAAIARLASLPEAPYDPFWPTITDVTAAAPGWSPMPSGQGRYLFRATVTSHP